jgi:lipoprotein-releasing system permease protein
MYRPLELFVGLRYLRAKHANRFVSFISLASILGIGVGVCVLIAVISIMNGFGDDLRDRLLSLNAHVIVRAARGSLADWEGVRDLALARPGVVGAAPFVEGEGMLANGPNLSGVQIQGVLPAEETSVSEIADQLEEGKLTSLQPGSNNILLGDLLAQFAEARVGDHVNVLVPRVTAGGYVMPRIERFHITGIFQSGPQEHDALRALVHMSDAAALFRQEAGVTGVRIRLADLMQAATVAKDLGAALGDGYRVSDWTEEQASIFRALRIEKSMMFVILLLAVMVAAFNIVATLVMVVTEKRSDIAILRTLGLEPRAVQRIFVVQGIVIGLLGTIVGVALGVAFASNVETLVPRLEDVLGVKLIPADVFYLTQVPSDLRWPEVAIIAGTAFALTVIATLYPARRAAGIHPAEALRYD